ncbi:MAG: hypothetical protein ACRD0K_07315 [Egibacteraceae bacterium]
MQLVQLGRQLVDPLAESIGRLASPHGVVELISEPFQGPQRFASGVCGGVELAGQVGVGDGVARGGIASHQLPATRGHHAPSLRTPSSGLPERKSTIAQAAQAA